LIFPQVGLCLCVNRHIEAAASRPLRGYRISGSATDIALRIAAARRSHTRACCSSSNLGEGHQFQQNSRRSQR
jgi:hypothetical protein